MNIETTRRIASKAIPGVFFTVATWLTDQRMKLRSATQDAREKLLDMEAELEELTAPIIAAAGVPADEVTRAMLSPRERATLDKLNWRIKLLQDTEIDPQYMRIGLLGLEGVSIDGTPASSADFRRLDPMLYTEILDTIKDGSGLSIVEQGNLESPTTSGAQAEAKANSTGAPDAENPDGSTSETAGSTSPTR